VEAAQPPPIIPLPLGGGRGWDNLCTTFLKLMTLLIGGGAISRALPPENSIFYMQNPPTYRIKKEISENLKKTLDKPKIMCYTNKVVF